MSELNNQITITSIYELGDGDRLSVRKELAEILKSYNSEITAFQIDKIRLVSYGMEGGNRITSIPGEGLLEEESEGRVGSKVYGLTDDEVNLYLQYSGSTQSIHVSRTKNVTDVELAITVRERDFKVSTDGYLYINIPVRTELANDRETYKPITFERGSFADDGDLLKGTWNDEHGSFEPAFDAKGNIIAFNLINKP